MTFEELQKANADIKPLKIGSKEYAEVNQRVKAFRQLYPNGCIITQLEKYEDGVVIFKASIYATGERNITSLLATGYAKEIEGSSNINRYSAIENCETSAVGRALGFLGIGIDTAIASYEEVSNAKLKQEGSKLATTTEKAGLIASAGAKGLDHNEVLKMVGFDRDKQPEGMTAEQYGRAMKIINEA